MLATHPVGYLRVLISIAALGLLAALLLLPAPVRAQTPDMTPPTLLAANVDGTSLKLIYSEALKMDSVPAASAYSVVVASATGVAPSSFAVSGAKVTLTLSTGAASGETVTVTYTVPSTGNKLEDVAGNDAAALTARAVTNNTGGDNNQPAFSNDTATRSVAENTANATQFGDAVTATDSDSAMLYYSLPSGDSTFAIGSNTGQFQTMDALNYELTTFYVVPVYVSDRLNAAGVTDSAIDDTILVTINVTDVNEAPMIGGDDNVMVPENTTAVDTYTFTDVDVGDMHTWSVENSGDGALFQITTGGVLSFKAAPDFDAMNSSNGNDTYTVTIKVMDNGSPVLSHTLAINVEVTDVNEPPVITTMGSTYETISKPEGTATSEILATYEADDPEMDSLTWSLSGHSGDMGAFTIEGGVLKFSSVPNFEAPTDNGMDNVYEVTVNVRDIGGSIDDDIDVVITVTDVNEPPVITTKGTSHTTITKAEETRALVATYLADDPESDTLTWSKTGDDADDFTIDDDGMLKFISRPNYESPTDSNMDNSYLVTVNVRDSNGSTVDDSHAVTVVVTNADDEGTASFTGDLSGGSTLTASVTDPDGEISSSKTYQWQRGDTSGGIFSNITVNATSVTYVPVAADVGKWLKVRVGYADAEGAGKFATSDSRGPIGASNSEPTFSSMTATRTLPENSGLSVNVVGGTITATDGDGGDTLTYSLAGTDAGKFEVDSNGQIMTKTTGSTQIFNFEDTSNNSFSVTLNVRDSKDVAGDPDTTIDDTIAVTINLTNVNEAPMLTSPPTALNRPENSTAVHTYAATDVDADTVFSWSVQGADSGKFEISSGGVLTFSNAPDFEMPTDTGDMNGNNVYVVTVKATDNGNPMMNDVHTLRVTVTDVNETPEITSGPAAISKDENTPTTEIIATYVATDPDVSSTGTMSWDLQGNDAGDFTITSTVNGTANLYFKNVPNYEVPADTGGNNVYDVTVRVRDNGSTPLQDTREVVVTVNDVNETPVISGGAAPSFAEIEFDVVGMPDLTIGTYTYTDEDLNPADTITWDLSGTDETHFSINSSSGVLSFSIEPNFEVPVDMGSGNDYVIVVEANDGAGGVGTFNVTVTVTNVDETPEVTSMNETQTFAEIEYDYVHEALDLNVDTFIARDEEDGTGIVWAVSGTDGGDFTISTGVTMGEGALFFRIRPNFEVPDDADTDNVYEVTLIARDTTGVQNSREYPVTVTVTDVDETPEFRSLSTGRDVDEIEYDSERTAAELSSIPATEANRDYWYRFEVRDEEGQDIIWSITGLDAVDFVIAEDPDFVMTANADESAIARWNIVPNFEDPRGSSTEGLGQGYVFTVNAFDGTNTATHEVFIRIDDVNEVPEFTGTPDLAITYNENATIDVANYVARDEEGGVTWSLTGTDAGDFSIDTGGGVTFAATPNYEMPTGSQSDGTDINGNVYTFTVVATDVLSDAPRRNVSVDVTVTVADLEEKGTITVDNLNPGVGDSVIFTLTDPDGGIFTEGSANGFNWNIQTRASGGSWQQIDLTNNVSESFSVTVTEDHTGLQLRAVVNPYTDRRGTGKSAESEQPTMAVTVDPIANAPPRFTGGGPNRIEEGGDARNVGDPMRATDRDPADTLTFGIQTSQYSDHFEINASTGQIRLTQVLDFETITGFVLLTVTLHDGMDADDNVEDVPVVDVTTILAITVDDVEERGVVTLSPTEPAVGTELRATLADGDGDVTMKRWQWSRSENGRDGWTNISGATLPSYTTTLADADFFLRARVTYTDRRGDGKSAVAITTERVFGENQRPTFPSTEDGARTVEENTQAGESVGDAVAAEDMDDDRLTYSLSGTDAATFSIVTTTGQLRTKEPLDFETKPSYSVTVEVHDGLDGLGQPSMSIDDMQDVTITIENVEEQGTVTLSSDTGTIRARVPVMATLADDDIPSGVVMWQWARSPNGRTDWADIQGATSATFTPTLEEDEGNYIRARASYTDGEDSGKMAEKVSPRVGDAPPVNSAPVFPSTETGQREVAEDETGGRSFGDPVTATDFNNDTLYYSLSGTDAATFEIGQNTGQLSLASSVTLDTLDYEGKRSYRITVEVSDRADPLDDPDMAIDDRQSVTVTVTNVNEAPMVTGVETASFEENKSSAVASYTGTDPERDTLTWTVSGNVFWISDRGQLYFLTPPSFEQRTSYTVSVMAADDGGLTGSLSVTVTMTDVEEDGVVTLSPLRGWEGTRFTASLADGDGSVSGRTWQWQRSSNRSSWQDIPGATSSSSSSAYTAQAEDVDMYLRATISYTDRLGSGKMASAVLAGQIGDASPPQNNEPEFTDTTYTRNVGQGTAAGRSIGSPVRATDDDPGDILTYSITGSDARLFSIDPGTGQLRTKDVLDYEPQGTNEKIVTVQVRDGFSSNYTHLPNEVDDTIQVTITVTQVAQRVITGVGGGGGGFGPTLTAPKFVDGFRTSRLLDVTAREGAAVGDPVAATHPNDDDVTYSLSGANASLFTVDEETGQIRLGLSVTLALGQTYTVNLTATDSTGTGAIIIVVIEVAEGVGDPYDLNRDGIIDKDEVLKAVADYFAELIERDEVLALVARYFAE